MRVGIISFAHGHAYAYAEALKKSKGVELVGIADDQEIRGAEVAKKYSTNYYSNYEDLLDQDIDAVIITSENYKHHEHVLAAAKKGKHVLCEKPIATNRKDALEMMEVCKENNVFLQIAFPVRFSTPIVKAKHIIETGELGSIIAIKGTNRGTNPGGWFVDKEKSGGGAVMDHTVHLVDIMRWYMNSDVKEVYAEVDNLFSDYEIDDCGIVTMEFENNVFASIDCSWSRNKTFPTWGDVTLEIIGTKGTLSVDAFAQKSELYSAEGAKWDYWGDDMNQALVEDFVTNVQKGIAPTITGEDGLKAMEVALAGYESAQSKRPVLIEKIESNNQ
ncbi:MULTISPECIES: Gfo/Idh/MocA family protein [Niallia]|jgi:UDP-N-acetylglucosamine 3-dehydrogenase|uniref:Gfo/Idh/MocA family protein n=1 Tax=Niallia TaxID=2837506 RepID=UPI00156135AB|nr:Gfo/Idh/MocA family oxidoreductase [Niallia circulans]NRG26806.1 Gfo/Idh/MocA family oxidoreductase [Niallia circulans]